MRVSPVLCAALMVAVALCCPAAEKITVDPNAPGVQTEPGTPSDPVDERVLQHVSYEAARKPVAVILDDLWQKTGVSLHAGYNKFDWQVRDRKINIFSKDATLAGLMNSIARVMKFKWSKEKAKDGKYIYRLYMDRKSLLDEEAQRAREEGRLAKLAADRRRKSLQSFADLADLSSKDAAKLRTENPYEYFLATSGIAKSVSAFFAEAPSVVEALANGEPLAIRAGSLSSAGKKRMLQTMKDMRRIESFGEAQPPGPDNDPDDVIISVNGDLAGVRYYMQGTPSILGEVELVSGEASVDIDLLDPESDLARTVGEVMLTCEQQGKSPSEAEDMARDRISQALVSDVNNDAPDDPPIERPDDPDLHAKVKLKPKSNELPDVQRALAESSGFAVVSDSFARTHGLPVPSGQKMELGDLLDKIGDAFKYGWDKHGSVIEFRDKRWFQKRASQIPDAWIEKWRARLKDSGTLELDDLVQMAALTEEQFKENIAEDDVLSKSGAPGAFWLMRSLLKMYGSLGQADRFAVFTEDGLGLGTLNEPQSAQLRQVLSMRNPLFLQRDPESLTLSGARVKIGKKLRYVFTISSAEDQEQIDMKMDLPKYEEPEDATQNPQ